MKALITKPKNNETFKEGRFLISKISLVITTVCLLVLSFFFWTNQDAKRLSTLQENLVAQADSCAGEVGAGYNRIYDGIERLTKREVYPDTDNKNEWIKDATFFICSFKGMSQIIMIDNDFNINTIVPPGDNDLLVGKSIVNMTFGEGKINIWQPIYDGSKLKGFVVGIVDTAELMEPILLNNKKDYMVRLINKGNDIFSSTNWVESNTSDVEYRTIVLQDSVSWQLTFAPTKALYDSGIQNSRRSLFLSLAFSFFVFLSLAFVQKYYTNSKILAYKKKSEEKYRLITENTSDVIWLYNLNKNIFVYMSPSIFSLLGYTVKEASKLSLDRIITPESIETITENMVKGSNDILNDNEKEKNKITEIQQISKNGDRVWVENSTKYRLNDEGEIEIVGVSRNIEKRKRKEEEILYLGYHDHLTGLYNRRFYEEELHRLDTKRNYPLSIIMGDVNGLKVINDSFGHEMGDELLKHVAEALKKGCRADDIIARPGGDEFVIILPKTDGKEVEQLINRIQSLLFGKKVGTLDVSVAFGYATKHREEEDIQKTLMLSEEIMYKNKLYESASIRSKTIDIIINTLFEKSEREMLHSKRVSELCEAIAIQMNFNKTDINQIRLAGLVHDIGKIGIDETILNSPHKLTSTERAEMQKHSEIGYRILSSVKEFSEISEYVFEHQEKWDGSGYPQGISGENISLQARIIAVADAYDAMTADRTYKKKISKEDAIKEMKKYAGTQFDPRIVKILIEKVLEKK